MLFLKNGFKKHCPYERSDGEFSIEEIIHRIKQFSNDAILEKFPLIRNKLSGDTEIWDEAYCTETIG